MRSKSLVGVVLLLSAFGTGILAADKDAPKGKPAAAPDAQAKAAMDAMVKAATPGEPHKKLAEMAGTWTVTTKSFEGPGEPKVSTGTSEITVILGGRFIQEHSKGSFDGQDFEGYGITGYDNVLKAYTGAWVDSMGTGMATSKGSMDAAGKVLTCMDSYADPVSGKMKTFREVIKFVDKDHHVAEFYDKGADGKEFKMMEMTYTRKG